MVSPKPERSPVLIGCSHGTRSPAGRLTIALLRLAIGSQRPGLEVGAAHVDVQEPAVDAVVHRLTAAGRRCVVVPLLLSTGHHVRHDVASAVRLSGGLVVAAAPSLRIRWSRGETVRRPSACRTHEVPAPQARGPTAAGLTGRGGAVNPGAARWRPRPPSS